MGSENSALGFLQRLLMIKLKIDARIGPVLVLKSRRVKIGFAVCHRRRDRSFRILGYSFPMCARCTGLWSGFATGLLLHLLSAYVPLVVGFALMLPLAVDWFSQALGLRESNNPMRFLTGSLFAIGTIVLFLGA